MLVLLSSVLHITAVQSGLHISAIVPIISGTLHTLDELHRAPRGLNQQSTAMLFLRDAYWCCEKVISPLGEEALDTCLEF